MLDAAVRVFADHGFRDTSMDAIAAEAEISKPMLYLYYGSKEELFGACMSRESGRFIEAMSVGFNLNLLSENRPTPWYASSCATCTRTAGRGGCCTAWRSVPRPSPPGSPTAAAGSPRWSPS